MIPTQLPDELTSVRIEQQLVGIEAMAGFRGVGTIHSVAIHRARPNAADVAVPDLVGIFRQFDALLLGFAARIEQAQFDLGGVCREQRKVDALPVPRGASRMRQPFAYPNVLVSHSQSLLLAGQRVKRSTSRHRSADVDRVPRYPCNRVAVANERLKLRQFFFRWRWAGRNQTGPSRNAAAALGC